MEVTMLGGKQAQNRTITTTTTLTVPTTYTKMEPKHRYLLQAVMIQPERTGEGHGVCQQKQNMMNYARNANGCGYQKIGTKAIESQDQTVTAYSFQQQIIVSVLILVERGHLVSIGRVHWDPHRRTMPIIYHSSMVTTKQGSSTVVVVKAFVLSAHSNRITLHHSF